MITLAESPPSADARPADGKARSPRPVRSVQDVGEALKRIAHDPKLVRAFERALGWVPRAAEIWIWGDRGIAIVRLLEDEAVISYVQNDRAVSLRGLVESTLLPWARQRRLRAVSASLTDRPAAWSRLVGFPVVRWVMSQIVGA